MALSVGQEAFTRTVRDGHGVVLATQVLKLRGATVVVGAADEDGSPVVYSVPRAALREDATGFEKPVALPSGVAWDDLVDQESGSLTTDWEPEINISHTLRELSAAMVSMQAQILELKKGTKTEATSSMSKAAGSQPASREAPIGGIRSRRRGLEGLIANYGLGEGGDAAFEDDGGGEDSEMNADDFSWVNSQSPGPVPRGAPPGTSSRPASRLPSSGARTGGTSAGGKGADDWTAVEVMQNMAKLQITQTKLLRKLDKKRDRDSNGSSSETDEDVENGRYGEPRRLKNEVHRHPEKFAQSYVDYVYEDMDGEAGQPWGLALHSLKLRPTFGPNTSLFRSHFMLATALDQALLHNHPKIYVAMCVALLPALHQAALDHGRWQVASQMVPMRDPLARVEFAGDPKRLHRTLSHYEKLLKLKKSLKTTGGGGKDEEEEVAPPAGGKRGAKGKDKDKDY